jgi:hypothetical protein
MSSKVFTLCCAEGRRLLQRLSKCGFCEQEEDEDGHFPYVGGDQRPNLRNHSKVIKKHAKEGKLEDLSPLAFIPHFDIVEGFTATFGYEFFASNIIDIICNGQLTSYLNYNYNTFMPVSTPSSWSRWSYPEFWHWIMYSSLPALNRRLLTDNERLKHHCLFVRGVYLLMQDEIGSQDIAEADRLLNLYCKRNEELYGTEQMTAAVHNLLHFANGVVQNGPLWSCSLPFLKMKSICCSRLAQSVLTTSYLLGFAKDVKKYFYQNLGALKSLQSDDCILAGPGIKYKDQVLINLDRVAQKAGIKLEGSVLFGQAKVKNIMYDKEVRGKRHRADLFHFLSYEDPNGREVFVKVKAFLQDGNGDKFLVGAEVILSEPLYKDEELGFSIDHIRKFAMIEGEVLVSPVASIKKPLYLLGGTFLCIPPGVNSIFSKN